MSTDRVPFYEVDALPVLIEPGDSFRVSATPRSNGSTAARADLVGVFRIGDVALGMEQDARGRFAVLVPGSATERLRPGRFKATIEIGGRAITTREIKVQR